MKTDPDFLAAYKAALAAKRAVPKPIPPPTTQPEAEASPFVAHPLQHQWPIEAIKLASGKARYFIVLRDNYFAEVKECGIPLTTTRHLLSLWKIPANHSPRDPIQIILDTPPLTKIFTLPFVFHDINQARRVLTVTIQTLAADL